MTDWTQALLAWFDRHRRAMPWRDQPTPYAVWISEVMLQQTQVDTVRPYFDRFMARFPDPARLAAASEEDVLRHWEGLGYYSRARNLRQAAIRLMEAHAGRVPATVAELLSLPGIGAYTAAAIASIAFGVAAPCVDGNVLRVMARFRARRDDIAQEATRRTTATFLTRHIPLERPGDFNQALMELGAMVCRPRQPLCDACPLRPACRARVQGLTATLPVKTRKAATPHHDMAAAIIKNREGGILIVQRPTGGLLGGLWDLPGGCIPTGGNPTVALTREIAASTGIRCRRLHPLGIVTHAYSHFRVTLQVFTCTQYTGRRRPHPSGNPADSRWATPAAIASLPFAGIARKALALPGLGMPQPSAPRRFDDAGR